MEVRRYTQKVAGPRMNKNESEMSISGRAFLLASQLQMRHGLRPRCRAFSASRQEPEGSFFSLKLRVPGNLPQHRGK